jgi:hypothetical protein
LKNLIYEEIKKYNPDFELDLKPFDHNYSGIYKTIRKE